MIPKEKNNGLIQTYEERIEKLNTLIENIKMPKNGQEIWKSQLCHYVKCKNYFIYKR